MSIYVLIMNNLLFPSIIFALSWVVAELNMKEPRSRSYHNIRMLLVKRISLNIQLYLRWEIRVYSVVLCKNSKLAVVEQNCKSSLNSCGVGILYGIWSRTIPTPELPRKILQFHSASIHSCYAMLPYQVKYSV